VSSLYDLRRAHFKGNDGKHGQGSMRDGLKGKDIYFNVPMGTEIHEVKGGSKGNEVMKLVADLDHNNQQFLAAIGGKGGRGNYK